jgi:hypothetical protein
VLAPPAAQLREKGTQYTVTTKVSVSHYASITSPRGVHVRGVGAPVVLGALEQRRGADVEAEGLHLQESRWRAVGEPLESR